jgi:accessory gene regulator B
MTDPIEIAAYKLAIKLKKWNPDIQGHVEDIRYGAAYYINYYSVIVISLIIGLITNELLWTCMSLLSFGILRRYTGGLHLPSLTSCAIFTIAVVSIIPHIYVNSLAIQIFNLVSFVLVCLFTEKGKNAKRIALMIICTNIIFLSSTLALNFFVQSLLLIKWRR